MLIERLLRINRNLPSYNYYLDVANYLIQDVYSELKKMQGMVHIDTLIQEIETAITTAKLRYKQESNPDNTTLAKKVGYLCKKDTIEKRFAQLKLQYAKKKEKRCKGGCIIVPFF